LDRLTVLQDLLDSLPSGPWSAPNFSKTEKILKKNLAVGAARLLRAQGGALPSLGPAQKALGRGKIWEGRLPGDAPWRLAVPIVSEGKLLGALALGAKADGRAFSREEKAFLGLFSFFLKGPLAGEALWGQFEKLNRQAALGFLSGMLAHEIRNPLTALQTFLQLFPKKSQDPQFTARFQKVMAEQVDRLQYLCENYLGWLKAGPGPEAALDLSILAGRAVEFLAPLFKTKGAQLVFKSPGPTWIRAGAFQIESLLLNLAQNAFHALPPQKGRVELSLRRPLKLKGRPGFWVELKVSDNGRGIAKTNLKRIFDPFFTTREGGAGLGLIICRRIVEQSGGFLTAQSRGPGRTSFQAFFPQADA